MFITSLIYLLVTASLVFSARGLYIIYKAQNPKNNTRAATGAALCLFSTPLLLLTFILDAIPLG